MWIKLDNIDNQETEQHDREYPTESKQHQISLDIIIVYEVENGADQCD
jgi:hypothetical protein